MKRVFQNENGEYLSTLPSSIPFLSTNGSDFCCPRTKRVQLWEDPSRVARASSVERQADISCWRSRSTSKRRPSRSTSPAPMLRLFQSVLVSPTVVWFLHFLFFFYFPRPSDLPFDHFFAFTFGFEAEVQFFCFCVFVWL